MQGAYSHWFAASEKKSAPITIVANELIQRFPARYIKNYLPSIQILQLWTY